MFGMAMLCVTAKEIKPFFNSGKGEPVGLFHGLFKRDTAPSADRLVSIAGLETNSAHEMGFNQAHQEELIHGLFKRETAPFAGRPVPMVGFGCDVHVRDDSPSA